MLGDFVLFTYCQHARYTKYQNFSIIFYEYEMWQEHILPTLKRKVVRKIFQATRGKIRK